MRTLATFFAAAFGASVGFLAGAYAALLFGIYEKTPVLLLALLSAMAFASAAVAGVSRLLIAAPHQRNVILLVVALLSGLCVYWLMRAIKLL